jgi:effector-binding domain-containing protein
MDRLPYLNRLSAHSRPGQRRLGCVCEHVVTAMTVAPRLTAVVAQTTTWDRFPGLWKQLLDEVYDFVKDSEELASTAGPGPKWRNVMLYKDDAPSVEVGVLVRTSFSPNGRVISSRLPGGKAAMTTHRGDYAQLDRAHEAVHRFARVQELELAGPRWEIYGHWRRDPRELETDVYYLLR